MENEILNFMKMVKVKKKPSLHTIARKNIFEKTIEVCEGGGGSI